MGKLRLYFRIRQRLHTDPMDFFRDIRERYAANLSFGPTTTTYIPLDEAAVMEARQDGFMLSHGQQHPSLIVHEMIGEMGVVDESEARDIAMNSEADHCYAEYVVPYRIEKGPE